ncbi:unnamed protein product [Bemisia tabaci]|uniref:Uncharacterized protein n=1 Tax=Bemisia tabaci TaxID=7038 RepID=A0A9P0AJX0_BEMTA|nr:unnamed protein product [Bemisia tabaci]
MKIAGCTSFTHAAILSRFCPNSVDHRSVPYQVSGVCQVPDHLCSFFNRLLSYCRSHQVKMNFTIEITSNSHGILRVGDGDDISLTRNMDGSTRRANLVTQLPLAAYASTATSAVSSVYNTSVSTSSGRTSTRHISLAQLAQLGRISSPRISSASASSSRTSSVSTSSARASSSRTSSSRTSSANPSSASTTSRPL